MEKRCSTCCPGSTNSLQRTFLPLPQPQLRAAADDMRREPKLEMSLFVSRAARLVEGKARREIEAIRIRKRENYERSEENGI